MCEKTSAWRINALWQPGFRLANRQSPLLALGTPRRGQHWSTVTMLAIFLCALDLGLACTLLAAEKADDNLRRLHDGTWDDDGGWLDDD